MTTAIRNHNARKTLAGTELIATASITAALAIALNASLATAAEPKPLETQGAHAADAAVIHTINIPAGPLDQALQALARQTNMQIGYTAALTRNKRTNGATNAADVSQALDQLLDGTDLQHSQPRQNTIVITDGKEPKSAAEDDPSGAGSPDTQADIALEEVVVTAQKRIERLQDVPVPVTAIDAQTLADNNQTSLRDYYTKLPGLSVTTDDFGGTPSLIVRGITTGPYQNPTVSIVIDDVPYGASTTTVRGEQAPDFDPSDLARIEVLRGPQGTLYGASSLGGLLKFVTIDPSVDAVSGRVQTGISEVENGESIGYNVRGAVNVPLSDTWAVRASAFTRSDPGYVDNVETAERGANRGDADGGRVSAMWQPSPDVSLKLSAMLNQYDIHGPSEVHVQPDLGDLQQRVIRGAGGYSRDAQAYSATLTAALGRVDLTSLSGYNVSEYSTALDFTSILGEASLEPFGVAGATLFEEARTNKFTQEVRLSAPLGPKLDWLAGVFYTREDTPSLTQHILAIDQATGASAGVWADQARSDKFTEHALFANLTFHITDRFDLQVGGRQSWIKETGTQSQTGPYNTFLGLPLSHVFPDSLVDDDAFTYLVTPQLKLSPDLMVYARLASGYRPGGSNSGTASPTALPNWKPDETQNYEIGVKASLLDRRLSVDASLYYIDWKDLPLLVIEAGQGIYSNASRAKSQGVELSVESRPLRNLVVAAWVAWNEAELAEDFPPDTSILTGNAGDRLPYSSRFSGSLSLEQEISLTDALIGFIGASVSYTGEREGVFFVGSERQTFPSFVQGDVHLGVTYDAWNVNLFVNNVTDERGQLAGGLGNVLSYAFHYTRPRTVGMSVSRSF